MAIINETIGVQNFELVLDRIGEILTDELANQKTLQPTRLTEKVEIFKERITSIRDNEEIYINVLFDGFNNTYSNPSGQQNLTNYFVDIYAKGKAKQSKKGDNIVATKLQKYLGVCRYILESTKYNILGFPPGLIGGTMVENIQMYEQSNTQDTGFSRMGRIIFSVKIQENQNLWDGVLLVNNITTVKLQETEQGYQFKITA